MLLTPIVVGLMWRALLNPGWGLLNWVVGKLGIDDPSWLSDPDIAIWTLAPRRHVAVDAVRLHRSSSPACRRCRGDVFEAAAVDGAGWCSARGASRCRCSCRRSCSPRSSAASTPSAPSTWSTASRTAARARRPRRSPSRRSRTASVLPLRLRLGGLVLHGRRRGDRPDAAAQVRAHAARGCRHDERRVSARHLLRRAGRDRHRRHRAVRVPRVLSTKKRLDILEVPPSLDFDWATIKANYDAVINDDHFLTLDQELDHRHGRSAR